MQEFIENHHCNKAVLNRVINILNDDVMSHLKKILGKQQTISLILFLVKEEKVYSVSENRTVGLFISMRKIDLGYDMFRSELNL